ncbi:hypothetical protein MKUB_55230 [Mycobacterium kubicae]|uniref:SDR family NAD(P)-dependent oxidoreductase n=1 Tax=Mycobacterium kubicae TaxID=120959 RepID=A0ABQ1BWB1_9MYCO|nr:hypothetical protein MKUB_55230 [Mycobacterium kubicae]
MVLLADLADARGRDRPVQSRHGHTGSPRGPRICLLINNIAGIGTYGSFAESDAEREHELMGVNVDALIRLTDAVLPGMLARGGGGSLNVASSIAFRPGPYQSTYGAPKAFVLSLSQALRAETRGSGVTVTALCPGITAGLRGMAPGWLPARITDRIHASPARAHSLIAQSLSQ